MVVLRSYDKECEKYCTTALSHAFADIKLLEPCKYNLKQTQVNQQSSYVGLQNNNITSFN